MAQAQIIRKGGSFNGPVSIGRIHWAEPVKGTLTVKDGAGNILASMSYSGSGQEPAALVFTPPLQSTTGITVSSPGGDAHVYLSGASGSGY
jgi:hypothetical protein